MNCYSRNKNLTCFNNRIIIFSANDYATRLTSTLSTQHCKLFFFRGWKGRQINRGY